MGWAVCKYHSELFTLDLWQHLEHLSKKRAHRRACEKRLKRAGGQPDERAWLPVVSDRFAIWFASLLPLPCYALNDIQLMSFGCLLLCVL